MAVLEPGHMLGRYRVENQLGAGGMGEVYRAWDDVLRRWVALKVVPIGAAHAQRLVGEARAVAGLHHPNIVAVHDVGEAGEYAFVSMELVEGKTLRDFIGDSSVTFDTELAWLLQIASALRAAHKSGIVHRDIKPDNVMITKEDQARVLDFGLAKAFGVDVEAPTEHGTSSHDGDTFRTAEGRVSGTPAYMAPEQLAGGPPSPGWDQYAWGVLACELLTGKHPRIAGLIGVSGRVKPESLAHVPPAVAEVVSRAMSPVADERFPSMDAVAIALGAPPSAPSTTRNVSNAPPKTSTPAPGPATASNMAIGDTLQVPVHPNAPAPQPKPRRALAFALGVIVLGSVAFAAWRFRVTPVPTTPTTASTALSSSVASSAPIVSVAPSITESAAPPASSVVATTSAPPPIVHPPRKLNIQSRGNPSPAYDEAAVTRGVAGGRFAIKTCVEQNPPAKVPHSFSISLELWNMGNEVGQVRDVRVSESPALAKCLREGLMGLSFGPSKTSFPPGAVFITVNVD